jgi:anti-sigma factor RsiW
MVEKNEKRREIMLNCRDVEFLIQDYLEESLLPSQRELLEAHLEVCPSCLALMNEMVRLDADFDGVASVDVPDDLDRRILSIVPGIAVELPPTGRKSGGQLALLAAAAAILVVGIFLGGRYDLATEGRYREVVMVYDAPAARSVAVVGDFNGWNTEKHLMVRQGSGPWRARLRLPAGIYQYGFIVNGNKWVSDPQAEKLLEDGFGRENSLLLIDG